MKIDANLAAMITTPEQWLRSATHGQNQMLKAMFDTETVAENKRSDRQPSGAESAHRPLGKETGAPPESSGHNARFLRPQAGAAELNSKAVSHPPAAPAIVAKNKPTLEPRIAGQTVSLSRLSSDLAIRPDPGKGRTTLPLDQRTWRFAATVEFALRVFEDRDGAHVTARIPAEDEQDTALIRDRIVRLFSEYGLRVGSLTLNGMTSPFRERLLKEED